MSENDTSWEVLLEEINSVFNRWDPLEVASDVDTEYMSISRITCSELVNKGTYEAVHASIQEEISEYFGIDVPEQDIRQIASEIMKLKNR